MDKDKLKDTLNKLHADLAVGEVDAELKELLRVLDSDIHLLLNKETRDSSNAGGLAARTQAISAKFAAEHPRIDPILRELAAILERMGI